MFAPAPTSVPRRGHVIDYLNKACEAAESIGGDAFDVLLPRSCARGLATRHEEVRVARARRPRPAHRRHVGPARRRPRHRHARDALGAVGWALLDEDPSDGRPRPGRRRRARRIGGAARPCRRLRGRLAARCGSTSRTTSVTGNRAPQRSRPPTPCTRPSCASRHRSSCAGIVQGAFRVYLDRFLNVPAARAPSAEPRSLDELETCWEGVGASTSRACGRGFLAGGGAGEAMLAELCRALFREDAGFPLVPVGRAAAAQWRAWRRDHRRPGSCWWALPAGWPPTRHDPLDRSGGDDHPPAAAR